MSSTFLGRSMDLPPIDTCQENEMKARSTRGKNALKKKIM